MTTDAADIRAAITHLVERGILAADADPVVESLGGGVSNDVLSVTTSNGGVDVVIKRPLARLRTEVAWYADPARVDTEGRALVWAARHLPHCVPEVLDSTSDYLVIARAPSAWTNWKDALLVGQVPLGVGAVLGHLVGTWQRRSGTDHAAVQGFSDLTAFHQLRVDPFYRRVAEVHTDLAPRVEATIRQMLNTSTALVHGDLTPKNVLVSDNGPADGLWLIDWEVAHFGDPSFDAASLLTHLLLKSVHLPRAAAELRGEAAGFLTALTSAGGTAGPDAHLLDQVGCFLLARVDGTSPADYLDQHQQGQVRDIGRRVLLDPPSSVLALWEDLS